MPIVGWTCHRCGGRQVPLDHFATTACGESIHPDYAAAVLADRSNQYVTKAVRVSHGLGCVRKVGIEEYEDYYADPLDFNAPLTGTAWHSLMEEHAEIAEVEVKGVIAGIKVNGKIDRLRWVPPLLGTERELVIEDWKHSNDFSMRYKKGEAAIEHVVQGSIYGELWRQQTGGRIERGIIWHHGSTSGKEALVPAAYTLLAIEDALKVKPHNGPLTVLELLQQADALFHKDMKWQQLPLVGDSMMFGAKSMCSWCAVQPVCMEAHGGAPF